MWARHRMGRPNRTKIMAIGDPIYEYLTASNPSFSSIPFIEDGDLFSHAIEYCCERLGVFVNNALPNQIWIYRLYHNLRLLMEDNCILSTFMVDNIISNFLEALKINKQGLAHQVDPVLFASFTFEWHSPMRFRSSELAFRSFA